MKAQLLNKVLDLREDSCVFTDYLCTATVEDPGALKVSFPRFLSFFRRSRHNHDLLQTWAEPSVLIARSFPGHLQVSTFGKLP